MRIHVLDRDEKAKDRFSELCPDLMNDDYNGKDILGEARYEINIRGGVDTNSTLFSKELSKITDATYIFVCLGTDEDNLAASVKIRSLCEGMQFTGDGHKPDIETVIYDSHLSASMGMTWQGDRCKQPSAGVSTFNGQAYNIHMIGALEQMYSVETMIHSELVRQAEEANESYANKVYQNDLDKIAGLPEEQYSKALLACQQKKKANIRAFYKYEYNYRSSIARVIHEKKSGELSLKSPELEHKRWNAYMRSEGYRFSGSEDESSKNVLAKLHHNLVPCANLNEKRDVPKDQ